MSLCVSYWFKNILHTFKDTKRLSLMSQTHLCTYKCMALSWQWVSRRGACCASPEVGSTRNTGKRAQRLSLLEWRSVRWASKWEKVMWLRGLTVSCFLTFTVSFSLQSHCLHSALWETETGEMVATDAVWCTLKNEKEVEMRVVLPSWLGSSGCREIL